MTNMFNKNVRFWVCSILLTIGSVLLFLGGPDYYSSRSFKHLWDIGHIVYFALLACLLSRWRFVAQLSLAGQWTIILLITLLVGVSIEFMQYGTERTPDTGDVLRDLTGSLLVLVFGSSRSASQPVSWRLSQQVAVLVLLAVQLWPLTKTLIDEATALQQFPLLSNFETPFEIDRWAGNAMLSVESMPSISQGKLLKLSLTTDRYSGVALNHFYGNWISVRTLKISLYNPDAVPLQIICRIHDLQHTDGYEEYEDRFNRSFLLMQGWNHIEIDLDEVEESPADRNMDMSRIRGLGIFVVSQSEPRFLYLDNVQLSP
jgi:VanZ family protein